MSPCFSNQPLQCGLSDLRAGRSCAAAASTPLLNCGKAASGGSGAKAASMDNYRARPLASSVRVLSWRESAPCEHSRGGASILAEGPKLRVDGRRGGEQSVHRSTMMESWPGKAKVAHNGDKNNYPRWQWSVGLRAVWRPLAVGQLHEKRAAGRQCQVRRRVPTGRQSCELDAGQPRPTRAHAELHQPSASRP